MAMQTLKQKGESDYDYEYDNLFFKAVEKEYVRSIELDNLIIDLDKENKVIGIQILEASNFLDISKEALLKIVHWEFKTTVHQNKLEVRLTFTVVRRNKEVEKNPIIVQNLTESLPDSEMLCEI